MASSYNRVILMGNLTRDPQVRNLPSGVVVADIGLAVNDRRKDTNGNWVDEATFVDITLWSRNAEIAAEYTRKGSSVLIEGRLKLDSWESEGQKRSKLKVVCDRLCLLGGRDNASGSQDGYSAGSRASQANSQGSYSSSPAQYEAPADMPPGDDIPF